LPRPGDHFVLFPGGKLDHVLRALPQSRGLALAILPRYVESQHHGRERRQHHQQHQAGPQARKKLTHCSHDTLQFEIV
jgi:hypothetical protein